MRFDDFREAAEEAYRQIPDEYKEGIDGLRVAREALPHPTAADVYTLGECVTEAYPSDWEGPETTRSVVVLYWGSFRELAELDPEMDWEEELWETLTHELRHHLEWLAQEEGLEGVDYAMEQEFRRWEGESFDPWYFQQGDEIAEGVYRVERRYYLEQVWEEDAFGDLDRITFRWRGRSWVMPRPEELGDVHFVWPDGLAEVLWSGGAEELPPESLEVVLVRKVGWWEGLKGIFTRRRPKVLESAEPVREASGDGGAG